MADVAVEEGGRTGEDLRWRRCSQCAGFPGMAESEMEAARALADLAVTGGDEQAAGWLPHRPAVAPFPDLDQGCSPDGGERQMKVHKFLAKKARKGCGSFNPRIKCLRMQGTFCRSGSADALKQDDKEAKRMRRVLANRESARQTIRRRQGLRDDLTKRISELIFENERLKIEKELGTKEYMLLKDRNQNLRSRIMIANGKKNRPTSEAVYKLARKSKQPSSSIKFIPSTCHNEKPFPQLFWPPMAAHLANPYSNIPSGSTGTVCARPQVDPHKWLNPSMVPICLVPCPWFHPMPTDNCSHSHPMQSIVENTELIANTSVNKAIEVPRICQITCEKSSSSHKGSGHSSIVMQSCHEGQWTGLPPKRRLIETAKSTDVVESDKEEHVALNLLACRGPSKKAMGGLIAAEARKRRKEITKLKIQFSQKRSLPC